MSLLTGFVQAKSTKATVVCPVDGMNVQEGFKEGKGLNLVYRDWAKTTGKESTGWKGRRKHKIEEEM